MSAITSGEIKIETAITIEDLQELTMEVKKNSHAVVLIKGFVPQEMGEEAMFVPMENTGLKVWAGDKLLFGGLISKVEMTHEGWGYQITIQGISSTIQIDCEKKNRTFQNSNSTYQEVMREVLKDTSGAGLNFYASDRKIESPLYQIEETDWEFIKRLASHLETAVVPNALMERPEVSIGLPEGRIYNQDSLNGYGERVWFDREKKSVCRRIRTCEDLRIGERVKWEGLTLTVTEKSCCLEKGLLCFRYVLAAKGGFFTGRYENPDAYDRLLPARVLDKKEEKIKVQFDIDKFQAVEEAYWYPWEPDMGNLVYCMPEKGEKVFVHLGGRFGEQARAVCCVHGNGEGHPEMKPADRFFTTADQKRMYLLPGEMGFRDLKQKNPLEVSISDDSGISTVSNKSMVISARDTIGIKGKNVLFQAPREVSMVRRDNILPTVINMCNGFDSVGGTNQVSMSGTGDANFPLFHEYEQEAGKEYSLEDMGKNVIASTPGVSLKSGLEKQMKGIMVDRL